MLHEVLCTLFLSREIMAINKEVRGFSETHSGINHTHYVNLPQCAAYSFVASTTALISSNHQREG